MKIRLFCFAALLMFPDILLAEMIPSAKMMGLLSQYVRENEFLPLGVPEVSPAMISSPGNRGYVDIDKLCKGKSLCFLDTYAPAEKGAAGKTIIQDFFESLMDSAGPLNPEEKTKIEAAFVYLSLYPFGNKMCKELTGGECTIKALENKGVHIKAKVLAIDRPAETILRGGKTLIIINRQPKFSLVNSAFFATYMGHELSHVEDYKKHGKAFSEIYRADTETKAMLVQMYVYNQIKVFYPGSVEFPPLDFMIRYWAWKENGGAKPPDFYDYGSPWLADDFSATYLKNASSGVNAIRNLTINYYYSDELTGEYPEANDKIHVDLSKSIDRIAAEYTKWRNDNPEYAFPVFIHEIKPQNGGVSGGGGGGSGGGGGGYNPPINPQPGFTPGGGATY